MMSNSNNSSMGGGGGMQQFQNQNQQEGNMSNMNPGSYPPPPQQQQQQQNPNNSSSVSGPPPPGTLANQSPALNQQQQQSQPPGQQQQQQAKEINAVTLCRLGQETVHEIVSRMQELFQTLKQAQPPDGRFSSPGGMDRKHKFQEALRTIKGNFKRLRVIYEKLEESFPSDKVVHFEADILQKSEQDPSASDDKKNTEAYKAAVEEYREVVEQVMIRNRHIKEVIDHLRQIIWDVNTMLAVRRE